LNNVILMQNLKELSIIEQVEITGDGKFWDWVKENYVFILIAVAIGGLVASSSE